MKEYPSINKDIITDRNFYLFNKLDGSNIRAEYSPKRGFYKFGTKTQMLGPEHPVFGEAISLIQNKYEKDLSDIFRREKYENVVCFLEFLGPNSFAGYHQDEPHDVVLFDVSPHKEGLLPPERFLKLFGHLDIPDLCYYGRINMPLIEQIRNSEMPGITFEGIVAKAKGDRKHPHNYMFKVKTRAWLDELKNHCKDDVSLFEKLA